MKDQPTLQQQRSLIRRARWAAHLSEERCNLRIMQPVAGAEFDPRTERILAGLHPRAATVFRSAMKQWKSLAAMHQLEVQLISGTRTWDEQHQLWLKGRGHPGPIVTNADAGQSNHNYGIAADLGLFRGGRYLDDLAQQGIVTYKYCDQMYMALVPVGERAGLTAGARWKSFPDEPHYELRPSWSVNMSNGAMIRELSRRHLGGIDIFA